jgi:glucuronokinase
VPSSAEAVGTAPARTALAGNPSDGYGGAVLAVTLDALGARATARRADELRVSPESELVRAVARRIGGDPSAIEWSTTVPANVGLGGSSAIAIATLRALHELHGPGDPDPHELALTALAVEREDLDIPGGRQDQLAQAHGGLTLMDFSSDPDGHVQQLDPSLLPPLVVAWRAQVAEHSGVPHAELRSRYRHGDMAELAALAHAAAAALRNGDRAAFAHAVDESFEHRRRMVQLHPGHVEMIHAARAAGATANYSGSGGAIVAVCSDAEHREHTAAKLARLGCGVLSAPA